MRQKTYTMLIAALALLGNMPLALADQTTDLFENLVPIEDPQAAFAYVDPNADFSVFKRVMILETPVAFRSNWQRDQNRESRRNRVSSRDMDRIKSDVSTLFNDVLAQRLAANDGYEIVTEPGEDVLLVRAAIIDLDVTAPSTSSPGRSASFISTSGAATLYIEMFDSLSGQILGRAADRRVVRGSMGGLSWGNRASNSADARRIFVGWADRLRAFLDSHYMNQ